MILTNLRVRIMYTPKDYSTTDEIAYYVRWDHELPRLGDRMAISSEDGEAYVGKVSSVNWDMDATQNDHVTVNVFVSEWL